MENPQNYGVASEPEPRIDVGSGPAMSAQEEKTWSALAHLSMFLNIFTGFLGPVVALIVWLVYKDRSQKVRFHAMQAIWYQVAWLVVLWGGWLMTGLLTMILIGFLLMPVMAIISLVPFVHSAYAAYRVGEGREFRYPLIAELIENRR